MACKIYRDFPNRVIFDGTRSAVSHACRPAYKGANYDETACGREAGHNGKYNTAKFLSGKVAITCKQCLAALGDRDYLKPEATKRYVIQTSDNMFFKHADGKLTGQLADAQQYKVRQNAEDRCSMTLWYLPGSRKKMSSTAWAGQSWHTRMAKREDGWVCKHVQNPKLTVRAIKMVFADRKPRKKR